MAKRKKLRTWDVIIKRDAAFSKCPNCASHHTLKRSRARNFFENVIKNGTFYKIYRCNNCGWRGFLSTWILTKQSILNLLFYIGFALVIGFVVYNVLGRVIK
ncbi:MAG: hypothetical protein IAE91_07735 [Ignavibacteriaceae bacterium]|nr:hypothetical protein [Ignavibacteriaceae bacterium]